MLSGIQSHSGPSVDLACGLLPIFPLFRMNSNIPITSSANSESILDESSSLQTPFTYPSGWYPTHKDWTVLDESGSTSIRIVNLTEPNRDEEERNHQICCQTTQAVIDRFGQEYCAKDHSLASPQGSWTTLSLRGNAVRGPKCLGPQRIDGVNVPPHSNHTMLFSSLRRTSSIVQRRSLSSKRGTAKTLARLEEMRRGLENILVPKLKEDVVSAKSSPKAKWVLSEDKDNKVPTIRRGVQAYVRISAFLTAAQAAKTFTRYLNIKTKDSNLMAPPLWTTKKARK